jgi:UDP-N-acetylmuramoylalanine--D-glutamate ligase
MSTEFAHKKILVLGAGVTGTSVARFLQASGAKVTLTDDNSENAVKPDQVDLTNFDAVVISPGWRQDHPLVSQILSSPVELLNEIDIAWNLRSVRAPHQKWIALTGTNGKTTTVEMTAAILQAAGINAVACGNVGDTVIDAVDRGNP